MVRRRFGELELGAAELVTQALLESQGFKDIRVAKRTRETATFNARRRDGLLDAKFAIRLIKGNKEISRQEVADLRKDLAANGARIGVVLGAGEAGRDARSEAIAAGSFLMLWCGEALADKLFEKKVGTTSIAIEIPDLDEAFFRRARDQGEIEDRKREERRLEREAAEERDRAQRAERVGRGEPSGPSDITAEPGAEKESPRTSSESGNSSSEPAALASDSAPGAQGSSDPNRDAQVDRGPGRFESVAPPRARAQPRGNGEGHRHSGSHPTGSPRRGVGAGIGRRTEARGRAVLIG